MRRPLTPDEIRVWAQVLATVEPARGRERPIPEPVAEPAPAAQTMTTVAPVSMPALKTKGVAERLEPGRRRRLERGRDPIDARIDLHGFDQDSARLAVTAFLERAHRNRLRAVLVITGQGSREHSGVLKRFLPEWLAAWPIRGWVAGWSGAHRRHGGEGALYVAIRRPPDATPPLTPAP